MRAPERNGLTSAALVRIGRRARASPQLTRASSMPSTPPPPPPPGSSAGVPTLRPPMDPAAPGRFDLLHKSFKSASNCLLTACSREVVKRAFPSFTDAERERLFRILTRVMKALHANIEEEFDEVCQEKQVAASLDKIYDFDEEQYLDALASEKTSVEEIEEKVSKAKKDEIEHLKGLLKKAEESNNIMKARIELLKKGDDSTASRDALNKLTQLNSACMREQ